MRANSDRSYNPAENIFEFNASIQPIFSFICILREVGRPQVNFICMSGNGNALQELTQDKGALCK